jgi:ABC-type transport system substrate-binding protein
VAIIDQQTHDIVAQVPIQDPVEGYFADGSFWFLNLEPLSFVQIDASTHRIVGQISSPVASVGSFAVDGPSLWVTDATAPVLWRMDIRTGREAAHYDYSAEGSGGLDGPAVGAGSIWTGVGRKILRVDPSTGDIQERITGEGPDPLDNPDFRQPAWNFGAVTAMSFGDGALFVPSEERLVKIDPSTDEVVYAAGMPTTAKFVTGGGGFGWATSEAGNSVFQVSPRGYKVGEFSTGEGPESIAFDGNRVWVANYDSASVGWIDVASGTTGSLSVGHPVRGIAAGAGLVAFTVGRGRGVVDRVEALSGDVLRLTFPEQFNAVYDPALATDPGMFEVERATCLKLLNQPVAEAPEGWGLQPEAAEAMPDISADGRTYTFRVREGFRFSPPSGEPVTAETFRYSLERALSPTLGPTAPGPRLIDDIVGEADFRAGREEHISGLVTAGDTLTITLTAPSGDLLQRLAAPYFCPVPSDTPILSGGVESETLASAGPYYATENTPGELLVLEANPNYDGDRQPGVDAIAVRTGLDQGDAVFLVEQGDSDGSIGSLDALYFGAVRDEPGYRITSLPGVRSVVLNANGPVFSDANVRAAVATAFDRYFSARFWGELPTDELIPPDLAGGAQDPSATLPDRKAAAEQMPDRGGSVTIGVQPCPQCLLIARGGFGPGGLVALMGRLGLDAKVEIVSRRDIFADPGAFDVLIWENSTDYQDTASYVAATIGGTAPASWYPSDLRAEASRVTSLAGPDRTDAAVALAERLIAEHIVIPYSLFGRSELLSDRVGCRVYPPFGFGVDLASLCINDQATPTP